MGVDMPWMWTDGNEETRDQAPDEDSLRTGKRHCVTCVRPVYMYQQNNDTGHKGQGKEAALGPGSSTD